MFNKIINDQQSYFKYNNLIEKNTFIDFNNESKILRKTKSLNNIKLDNFCLDYTLDYTTLNYTTLDYTTLDYTNLNDTNLNDTNLNDTNLNDTNLLEKKLINNSNKKRKKQKKEINEFDKNKILMDDIMLDVDKYIIKRGVYNEIKFIIDAFKENNSNIIKTLNKNERKCNIQIACMNKYIDNQVAIYLSNIRNKLYLDIICDFDKLKEEKRLDLYINEEITLIYKDQYSKFVRKLDSYIKL